MPNQIKILSKIKPFKKTIEVASDKSLSIRAVLLASQAVGVSTISNILESEDVLNAIVKSTVIRLSHPLISVKSVS